MKVRCYRKISFFSTIVLIFLLLVYLFIIESNLAVRSGCL